MLNSSPPPLLLCREGVTCDDSCEFAFDGTCDDGSEGDYEEYYEQYGYYRDDDLGGYAGGDGTEGERAAAGGTYEEVCMYSNNHSLRRLPFHRA